MADVVGIDQARERDAFEAELQQETCRRLNATIVTAINMQAGTYDEGLHLAIVRNLFDRFTRSREPLMAHFAGLRELPMDDESRAQRLAAFDEILHHYLPGVLREEVPMDGDEPAGAVHTEKLNVN
jgi:hypothetical protein